MAHLHRPTPEQRLLRMFAGGTARGLAQRRERIRIEVKRPRPSTLENVFQQSESTVESACLRIGAYVFADACAYVCVRVRICLSLGLFYLYARPLLPLY